MPSAAFIHLNIPPFFLKHSVPAPAWNEDTVVWRIPLYPDKDFALSLVPVLSIAEVQRSLRYVKEDDRQRFLMGRGMVKLLLAGYLEIDPVQIEIREGQNKKPELAGENPFPIHFNISHSGNWVIIGFSNEPIGVDIEKIEPDFDYDLISAQHFSALEKEYARTSAGFYEIWTRKEALAKALGSGLPDQLTIFSALDQQDLQPLHPVFPNNWTVVSFLMDAHYAVSVASDANVGLLRFMDFFPAL